MGSDGFGLFGHFGFSSDLDFGFSSDLAFLVSHRYGFLWNVIEDGKKKKLTDIGFSNARFFNGSWIILSDFSDFLDFKQLLVFVWILEQLLSINF